MGSKSFTNKVVGIFSDHTIVDSVLNELNNNGYDKDDISILAKDFNENSDQIVDHSNYTYSEAELSSSNLSNIYAKESNDTINTTSDVRDVGLFEDSAEYNELPEVSEKDPKAMVKGATAGGALGLIAGLGLLMIPGIGAILAAGPLAAALTATTGGAAIGVTAGTLIGLFNDEGIPSDRSDFYNSNFNKGDILVIVHTDEGRSTLAREILAKFNPDTIDTF